MISGMGISLAPIDTMTVTLSFQFGTTVYVGAGSILVLHLGIHTIPDPAILWISGPTSNPYI